MPQPNPLPPDVAAMIANIFTVMQSRGFTEPIQVYAKTTTRDAFGKAIGYSDTLLGTIPAVLVESSGGSSQRSVEGERAQQMLQLYYPINPLLTDENFPERWVVFPVRSTRTFRLMSCQASGPYMWAEVEAGATADIVPK